MSEIIRTQRHFGDGPLSQITTFVYTLSVVEILFVMTTVPGLAVSVLLERHPSNIPLFALAAVPVGPALSAALYTLQFRRDPTDLRPAILFWRGYRVNARGCLLIWVPLLVLLTVIGINLAYLDIAGVPRWWAAPLLLIALIAALWALNALVILSLFCFRVRDVARLALYFLLRLRGAAVGNACLLFVTGAVVVFFSEVALLLAASAMALVLLHTHRTMITEIERDFVA
ncbi:MAG: hypothetical protein QG622_1925 [Actinomycetota bacterium]|nr:hypothetical protein [Actinomycetota bacterium]